MAKLTNKVAMITGASSGIGEATAKRLAEEGAKVVLAGRSDEKLQRVAEHLNEGDYLITPTNVMYRDDVDALVENAIAKFGKVDIFVNCAGINLSSKITDYKVDDWDKMVDTNIKG
ncbi:SDR family NAD(P)-dependent oxidoreductase, partial [Staphylococcus sp.]